MTSGIANSVVEGEKDEHSKGENLEGKASESYVYTRSAVPRGDGGQCAAGGLEDERNDIAGYEEPIVQLRGEARVLGAQVDDAAAIVVLADMGPPPATHDGSALAFVRA